MKTIDLARIIIVIIAILSLFVLFFNTTVHTLSAKSEVVTVNNEALKEGKIEIEPAIAKIAEENKTEIPKNVDIAIAKSQEDIAREALEAKMDEVVYENMTLGDLSAQLDRSLNSTLSGQGITFASYAAELGIDPYLAVAIVLHETGCKWQCSGAVNNYYNVGGMMGHGGLLHFNSLNEGIRAYMDNLYNNYVSKGLTTAELMAPKYAASPTWASNVNSYINEIKAN